ncbi:general substrate transporter [Plectosphaerella cucumerina]|uniref:General substrate transporter n=1 Tax=Plectosphaerella cucumerina TaxID=40658 RepID=A0A8K0T804_9PEZI|nr:general substrate transporter [Plectosphaerella cucumerina]
MKPTDTDTKFEATEPKMTHEEDTEKTTGDAGPLISAFAGLTRAQTMRKFWRLFLAGLAPTLGGMYVGYGSSVIGSIVANKGFIEQFATVTDPVTGERVLDANHIGIWGAVTMASQILIQLISPFTADRWGRKFNMYALTVFFTLSIILTIVAKEWILLTVSRVFQGFASGLLATSIMIYMSEVSMPQFRGALLGSFSFFFGLGQLFLAIGLKVLEDTNPMAFRNIFYSELVFLGLWIVPLVLLPETPTWYARKGQHEKARKALSRLVGKVEGYDLDHEYRVLLQEIDESAATTQKSSEHSWRALLTRVNIKRTLIATMPYTFQNFVGVPLIFGNTTYFFALANVEDPFLGKLIINIILLAGIISSFYWVDKIGRRFLVIAGGAVMGCCTLSIGGLAFREPDATGGIVLVFLCSMWAFIYANSLAPIGWVSLVEVSTPELRAKSTAVAAIIQSCSGVLFSYTVPLMLSNQGAGWGQKIGFFFAGVTFLFLIPVIFFFPETKGRTYLELDELFERRVPAWRFASTVTSYQAGAERQAQEHAT